MKRNSLVLFAMIIILGLLLSACDMLPITVKGGGWLPYYGEQENPPETEEPIGKTTFGFTVKCFNAMEEDGVWSYDVKGHLQYVDHNTKMAISGKVSEATQFDEGGIFYGEYTSGGETGTFTVGVIDNGEPGTNDYFGISIDSGPYEGYINEGKLSGGNIQIIASEPMQSQVP